VDPGRPSVLEVSLQRRVRGQGTAAEDVRVGQNPRTVADHRERLSGLDVLLHDLDRCLVHAQLVGVSGTARKDNPVELSVAGAFGRGIRLRGRTVDRKSTRLNSSHVSISYAVFCLK